MLNMLNMLVLLSTEKYGKVVTLTHCGIAVLACSCLDSRTDTPQFKHEAQCDMYLLSLLLSFNILFLLY